ATTSRARRSMKPRGVRASGRSLMEGRLPAAGSMLKDRLIVVSDLRKRRARRAGEAPSAWRGFGGSASGRAHPLRTRRGRMVVVAVMVRGPRHDGRAFNGNGLACHGRS